MNCIVTLKINDYFPKIDSIPYENFVCLFTYGDFFGKIPLIKKSNNICKHEIETINSDLKYNIHILEYNESSLIGICEMVIPLIKIKKISAPGTMIQEQKIKLIIDVNTKRKLFGKLINSDDIYLVLCAEVFIPDKKNIIQNNDICLNSNNIKKLNTNSKQIHVRINKKNNINSNILDGSPRTVKKRKMLMEMKSNREMMKKDISNDNINMNINKYIKNTINSTKSNTINYDINDEKNSTGMFRSKMKLENNQIKVIDFRNKNDSIFDKNNEINLTTKEAKKKFNKKRSPRKKVTILELLEQKIQPLLSSNNNNEIMNNRSNTYNNISNGSNIKQKSDIKNSNNKSGKKTIQIKSNKNDDNKSISVNSNKFINSIKNSPGMIVMPQNQNVSSPNTINTNKIKRNNSKGLSRINKKYNNNFNLYNFNGLNETDIDKNSYNTLLIRNKRNSSQEAINRNDYKIKDKEKENNNIKDSFKMGNYKRPKIDTSIEMLQRKSNNNNEPKIKNAIKKNNSSYSNNGILSTEERTEQGLSEIDKIILEKGTELRDQFQSQLKSNNSNSIELNNKNNINNINVNLNKKYGKMNNENSKNNLNRKIDKLYYDIGGENQIIGGANYTIETPKTNKDMDCMNNNTINNTFDNKSSFCSSSQSLTYIFNQEDLKNNYIGLIDLYYLLNAKLKKTIYENNDLYKKLIIFQENYNYEIKQDQLIKNEKDKNDFSSFINTNLKHSLNDKIIEQLAYIKNLENKLYQDIFGFSYDDYEIIRTKEIERVNKLNEERKLNILLKVLKSIIDDCGNVSQIFYDNKQKEKLLKNVLSKYKIKEKKEGEENYINLRSLNLNNDENMKYNKYSKYHHIIEDDIFENKVIREVDEDKEEEESVYTASNKKKNDNHFYFNNDKNNDSQNIESIRQSLTENEKEEKEDKEKEKEPENKDNNNNNNNLNENNNCNAENENHENEKTENENKNDINEEDKKIEIMKDILINNFREKYGKKNTFTHVNKNEFLFDNKYKIYVDVDLDKNNEMTIDIENNKYNLEQFISVYCKDKEDNIKKETFVYTKKRTPQQTRINSELKQNNNNKEEENIVEHKRKRKRRIDDDDSEDENNDKKEGKE